MANNYGILKAGDGGNGARGMDGKGGSDSIDRQEQTSSGQTGENGGLHGLPGEVQGSAETIIALTKRVTKNEAGDFETDVDKLHAADYASHGNKGWGGLNFTLYKSDQLTHDTIEDKQPLAQYRTFSNSTVFNVYPHGWNGNDSTIVKIGSALVTLGEVTLGTSSFSHWNDDNVHLYRISGVNWIIFAKSDAKRTTAEYSKSVYNCEEKKQATKLLSTFSGACSILCNKISGSNYKGESAYYPCSKWNVSRRDDPLYIEFYYMTGIESCNGTCYSGTT